MDCSLTLAILYKDIIIAPVDNPLPDFEHWSTEKGYENKELGIYSPWLDWNNARDEIAEQIKHGPVRLGRLALILRKIPRHSWWQILSDTRYEMRFAKLYGCPVICSGGRRALIQRLAETDRINDKVKLVSKSSINVIEDYIDISGLIFTPHN